MAKPTGWKRKLLIAFVVLMVLAVPVTWFAWYNFFREVPQPAWITDNQERNFL
jgi:hypothetical protein